MPSRSRSQHSRSGGRRSRRSESRSRGRSRSRRARPTPSPHRGRHSTGRISRSAGRLPGDVTQAAVNTMRTTKDFLQEFAPEAPVDVRNKAADKLISAGFGSAWQLRVIPMEVLYIALPPAENAQELTVVILAQRQAALRIAKEASVASPNGENKNVAKGLHLVAKGQK